MAERRFAVDAALRISPERGPSDVSPAGPRVTALLTSSEHGAAPGQQRSESELLLALGAAARRLGELDAAQRSVDAASRTALVEDVAALLTDVLACLTALELVTHQKSDEDLSAAAEAETWIGLRSAAAAPQARLEDICFVAGLELSRTLGALVTAGEPEAAATAVEAALRKLYRVLHAVLEGAREKGSAPQESDEQLQRRLTVELESALAVRKLYARFRKSLRRPEGQDRQSVLTALRYAASALASLVASPHYHALRSSDRDLLRQLRDRLLEWAHAGNPTSVGLQLLEDVFTCAELLRGINGRQELRAHDMDLVRELVADATRARSAWLEKLERLVGMDDTLDSLASRLAVTASEAPLIEIMVRLSFLVGA